MKFVLRLGLLSKLLFLLRIHVYLKWPGVEGLLLNIKGR